jgi:hypothetical protein
MKKIKNRDSQALSWLSRHRTDVSAESPRIGTDLSKGKRWRKYVDILPKVLSKINSKNKKAQQNWLKNKNYICLKNMRKLEFGFLIQIKWLTKLCPIKSP